MLNGLKGKEIFNLDTWLVFLLSTIADAFGSLIFELINLKGNWEVKHKPTEDELLQS